jgi:NADH:ubiquinone oxidoreductase subunit 4 (subunit M)
LILLSGIALLIIGIGFKLGVVPFHMWTPDVYQGAPAPVSAFIATISKGSMVALLLRVFLQGNVQQQYSIFIIFALIAAASMFVGNILALFQNNLKRILAYSSIAHLGYLLVAFLAIAFAEQDAPVAATSGVRLRANFGLGLTNGLLMLALPTGTAAASLFAVQHGWGLLHSIGAPWLLGALILLAVRSLATYGLHRTFHAVPWLWRFHRVHHSDVHCDLSTSFRSHPVEALIALPLAMLILPSVAASNGCM